MENKINIAELLKDCPQGMELDCSIWDNVVFDHIDTTSNYPIYIKKMGGELEYLTEDGHFNFDCDAKCVIFPKGKTTWEGFQRPFKDGDILTVENESNPFIFYCDCDGFYNVHCALLDDDFISFTTPNKWTSNHRKYRFATEEEKEKLFQAIKDNGYRWNEETKTLEKLPKFKDGDIVVSSLGHIHILKNRSTSYIYVDITHNANGSLCKSLTTCVRVVRLATEEEKQKLFKAIKDNGYRWNAETKTLEKLIELKFKVGDRVQNKNTNMIGTINLIINDEHEYQVALKNGGITYILFEFQDSWELVPNKFNISNLKPFDKVLVRCSSLEKWHIDFFEVFNGKNKYSFTCLHNNRYNECIPYEGNEHLLGTTNDCDEFYKNW